MDTTSVSCNREKLKELLTEILLLEDNEFRLDLNRSEVDTWDSLSVVAIAAGVEETFGYHFTAEEAVGITSVPDIISTLERNGITFVDGSDGANQA